MNDYTATNINTDNNRHTASYEHYFTDPNNFVEAVDGVDDKSKISSRKVVYRQKKNFKNTTS